jgi:hypothetical protein
MAKTYTSILQAIDDVALYCALNQNTQLTLNLFPATAQNKVPWFAKKWANLYQSFNTMAAGDESLETTLAAFNQFIELYNIISANSQNTATLLNSTDTKNLLVKMTPFFVNINMNSLQLSDIEQQLVSQEINRVNSLVMDDFISIRNYIRQQIAILSIQIGNGDPQGDALIGVTGTQQRNPQPSDYDNMDNLIDLINIVDGIIFNYRNTEDKTPNLLQFAASNTDPTSGFNVNTTYLSSIAMPFETSLEYMAEKYLGTTDAWYSLVTVNNLQSPYVDEVGTKVPLLVPGLASSVLIPNTLTDFCPVGQSIVVGSAAVKEESRTVLSKIESNDGTITLFLSGEANLVRLLPAQNAYVRIYAPHTVRTNSYILIPLPIAANLATTFIPKSDVLKGLDNALLAFGVDIKRDTVTGDYLVDNSGNFVMCWGLDNVRQAIFFLLRTEIRELPFHQDYGINSAVGSLIITGDEGDQIAGLIEASILRDPRFTKVSIMRVRTLGTQVTIDVLVTISGSLAAIPLSFIV